MDAPSIPRADDVVVPVDATALIVVDMQNDFAHPDGALFAPDTRAAIPVIADLLARAREAGVRVLYTQDWHDDDDPEFAIWGEHAKAETWGAQIVAELTPDAADTVVKKLRYDAFYGTPLDHLLRRAGARHVVVVGTVANICVLHTAGSAALRHYDVVLAEDGVAAITPFDKLATLRQVTFLYAGRVAPSSGIRFV